MRIAYPRPNNIRVVKEPLGLREACELQRRVRNTQETAANRPNPKNRPEPRTIGPGRGISTGFACDTWCNLQDDAAHSDDNVSHLRGHAGTVIRWKSNSASMVPANTPRAETFSSESLSVLSALPSSEPGSATGVTVVHSWDGLTYGVTPLSDSGSRLKRAKGS